MRKTFGRYRIFIGLFAAVLSASLIMTSCFHPLTLTEAEDSIRPYLIQIGILATNLADGRALLQTTIGSGLMVNRDGYVITANHVIEAGLQYLGQIQAVSKELIVIVPPYKGMGISSPQPDLIPGNAFDVIAADEPHDLVLLRMKMMYMPNPFNGAITPGLQYSTGATGSVAGFERSLIFHPNIPSLADILETSSYASEFRPYQQQLDLVTETGHLKTQQPVNLSGIRFSGVQEGYVYPQLMDVYELALEADSGNSGGPVYSQQNASVLGIHLKLVRPDNSSSNLSVPGRFIADLLRGNNIR